MTQNQNSVYFKNLDILRFVAVTMVMIEHIYEAWSGWFGRPGFMITNSKSQEFTIAGKYIDITFKNCGFGVDVFFLISGFLITYLLICEKDKTGKINLIKFYIRRSLRIWPIYFLLLALAPSIVKITNQNSPDYLPNFLFYNNFHAIAIKIWQYPFAHLWSICIEEHFYLFWPILVFLIKKENIKSLTLILIVSSIIFRIYLFLTNADFWYYFMHTFSRIDVLLIGSYFAIYIKESGFKVTTTKLTRTIIYLIFILVFCLEPIYTNETIFVVAIKKYFFVGIVGFAMANFIFNDDKLFKIPFEKMFNYLGKVSYGTYLYSNALIPVIIIKIMYPLHSANMYFFILLNFVVSYIVSIALYELFEKQILKLKKRFEVIPSKRIE